MRYERISELTNIIWQGRIGMYRFSWESDEGDRLLDRGADRPERVIVCQKWLFVSTTNHQIPTGLPRR